VQALLAGIDLAGVVVTGDPRTPSTPPPPT
jgi:hypothetical protein